jgi:hypothetical protein
MRVIGCLLLAEVADITQSLKKDFGQQPMAFSQ